MTTTTTTSTVSAAPAGPAAPQARRPGLGARWTRFWFEPAPTDVLGLLRLYVGLTFLLKLTGLHGATRIERLRPRFPVHEYRPDTYYFDTLHLAPPGFDWLPVVDAATYARLETALFVAAALFTMGLFARLAGCALALLYAYVMLLTQLTFNHHEFLLLMAVAIIGPSHCGDRFGVDAWLARRFRPAPPPPRPIMPVRMLQVLVACVYFYSVAFKLNAGWFNGEMFVSLQRTGGLRGPVAAAMMAWFPAALLTVTTLAIETLLIFGWFVPRLRRLTLAAGILLHVGIDLTMDVGTYSYTMIALYIAFTDPRARRNLLVYDRGLATGRRVARFVWALDWLARFQVTTTAGRDPGGWGVVAADGSTLSGRDAVKFVLSRLPATFLLSFLVPGRLPPERR